MPVHRRDNPKRFRTFAPVRLPKAPPRAYSGPPPAVTAPHVHAPASYLPAPTITFTARNSYNWVISIPVWGERHFMTMARYVIPSIEAAAKRSSGTIRYVIHTDRPDKVAQIMPRKNYQVFPLAPGKNTHQQASYANKQALESAAEGEVVAFINSDMVPSIEVFEAAEKQFRAGKYLIMMAGTRTLAGPAVPVGADSKTLLNWCWEHRHPWITDCIWPGRSNAPSIMFFEKAGTVVQHGFHLHPFALVKDWPISFAGSTIDADLGSDIPHDAIHVVTDPSEMAFAEISPPERTFGTRNTTHNTDTQAAWADGHANDLNRWLFTQRIVLKGNPTVDVGDESVVATILSNMRKPYENRPKVTILRDTPKTVIAIPAWDQRYIDCALRHAIPSALAALGSRPAQFNIFTNAPEAFAWVPNGKLNPVPQGATGFQSLTAAQIGTWQNASAGSIVLLLNADIVVSREVFDVAERIFAKHYRALASTGIRTLESPTGPPIGATARDLLKWSWDHRHQVIENSVWGRGKTIFPVAIYFEKDGNVVAHSSHLHPFVLLKDERAIAARGTIDDTVLQAYTEAEVFYPHNAEVGFTEISPPRIAEHFMATGRDAISADLVVGFAKEYVRTHIRNFEQAIRIVGTGDAGDAIAATIAQRMGRKR